MHHALSAQPYRQSEIRTDGIVLVMQYNEEPYWTLLTFPDVASFRNIFQIMKKSIGLNIQEIGNIDINL